MSGCIEVPQRKLSKLLGYIAEMKRSSRTTRRHFEKPIGLAMWLTQLWPYMRIWIRHWYSDLYAIPATHFSIDYGDWHFLVSSLNDDMTFRQRPKGTAIPIGGTLLSVRHQSVSSLSDLQALRLSDKRIWMRIRDPQSNRRHISEASLRILGLFESWLQALSPMRPLTPKRYWNGECAADACAAGVTCQIGGFLKLNDKLINECGFPNSLEYQTLNIWVFKFHRSFNDISPASRHWHKLPFSLSHQESFRPIGFLCA